MASKSYLIIGAGVFGVSTAYTLIQKYPKASVTIVDRNAFDASDRVAASWDWNKVVRADYDDLVYCRLALEAQDIFESDPLWKPYFHMSGMYWICRSDYASAVIENYKTLGRGQGMLAAVPAAEARKMHGGVFGDADYDGVKDVLVNKTSGWGAAGDCLRAVTKRAVELGVKYVTAEASSVLLERGRCVGVKTSTGQVLKADTVVLATGAYTPKLLELSAATTGLDGLSAGGRIVAGGITTGLTQLDKEEHKKYAAMPVGVQGYTAATGTFHTHPQSFASPSSFLVLFCCSDCHLLRRPPI